MIRTQGLSIRSISVMALFLGLIHPLPAAADGAPAEVAVRQTGATRQVVFLPGGNAGAVSLHTTDDTVSELRLVKTSGMSVIFASWRETGRDLVAVSIDGGATWSRAREMRSEIPLRSGIIDTTTMASPWTALTENRGPAGSTSSSSGRRVCPPSATGCGPWAPRSCPTFPTPPTWSAWTRTSPTGFAARISCAGSDRTPPISDWPRSCRRRSRIRILNRAGSSSRPSPPVPMRSRHSRPTSSPSAGR